MRQELATQLGNAAVVVTASTAGATNLGWFQFISENSNGLSILLGFCSLFAALCFYAISLSKQSQATKNEIEIKLIKDKLEATDNHLIDILVLLKGQANEEATKKRKNT